MKKIIFLLCLGLGAAVMAQTAAKKKEPVGDTDIKADRFEYTADYDKSSGRIIYAGHVLVENLRTKMLCDRLVIFLPKNGEQPNHIEAQTNVVIVAVNQGETTRATCSLAVYTRSVSAGVTNAIVTLTGYPLPFIENAKGSAQGERIVWNLTTGDYNATGSIKMNIKQSAIESSGTNKSAIKLF
jgi:lipopolysaccharide export system protein LptA